jgi:hypothetical protein
MFIPEHSRMHGNERNITTVSQRCDGTERHCRLLSLKWNCKYNATVHIWSPRGLADMQAQYLNQKICEELIAYFLLIRNGPHRKWRLQQLFVPAGMSLLICHLAKIRGNIDSPLIRHGPHKKWRVFYCWVNSLLRERVYLTFACQRRWGGLRFHYIDTKSHKDWFRHSNVNRGDLQTHGQHGDHINRLERLANKKLWKE